MNLEISNFILLFLHFLFNLFYIYLKLPDFQNCTFFYNKIIEVGGIFTINQFLHNNLN